MNETQPLQIITETFAQETREQIRFLHFRPWYEDRNVLVGGQGASFGVSYASLIASSCRSTDDCDSEHCETFVLMSDPNWADRCTRTRGNRFAIGGSPEEYGSFASFKARVESVFPEEPIYWLAQEAHFPYRLSQADYDTAGYWVAAVGDSVCIEWPSMALAMPTVDSPSDVREASLSYLSGYPGNLRIVVVSNGSATETLNSLRETEAAIEDVHVLSEPYNLGYGQGCNRGLEYAIDELSPDLVGVTNDDVIADSDCLPELVCALRGLEAMGLNPGAIGPVSNSISGRQQVDIGAFETYAELKLAVHRYREGTARSVTQVRQLRGLLLIFTPELLNAIGGFDPRFGFGNFEDDDHNLRTHLAGYSLWIADGAFLYHRGSQTFRKLKIDYEANIRRNAQALMEKWQLSELEQWPALQFVPRNVTLHVPFNCWKSLANRPTTTVGGEQVCLLDQASNDEFLQWLMENLERKPRSVRAQIIRILEEAA